MLIARPWEGPLAAIVDRREIETDTAAVRRALEWSPRAAQAFGLPPLMPTGVRCNPANGCIEVVSGTLNATPAFVLRAEALGDLLISYCNRAGMPMPRQSDKGIRVEREHAVLVFTLRLEAPPLPEAPEGQNSRAPEAVQAWSWIETPS
jgi:hypothetical protein